MKITHLPGQNLRVNTRTSNNSQNIQLIQINVIKTTKRNKTSDINKKNNESKSSRLISTIEHQRRFMDEIYKKLEFKSMSDWEYVSKYHLMKNGCARLIQFYYHNSHHSLLTTVYPNFPFHFEGEKKSYTREFFESSKEEQRDFLSHLSSKLQLKSIDDWVGVSPHIIVSNGGKYLMEIYHHEMFLLLLSLYPYHKFDFNQLKLVRPLTYFRSIDNQRQFMEILFVIFHLTSLDDWKKIHPLKLNKYGGLHLLRLYHHHLPLLLSSLYPHYPFSLDANINNDNPNHNPNTNNEQAYHQPNHHPQPHLHHHQPNHPMESPRKYFKASVDNQLAFMNDLFSTLKLKQAKDKLKITKKQIIKNGGKELLKLYAMNTSSLLRTLYPHLLLPSPSPPSLPSPHSINEDLFNRSSHPSSLPTPPLPSNNNNNNNSFSSLPSNNISNNNDNNNDIKIDEENDEKKREKSGGWIISTVDTQRLLMDDLYVKMQLKSMEDWKYISKYQIIKNGGGRLLQYYYHNDIPSLLSSIYPNYPFQLEAKKGEEGEEEKEGGLTREHLSSSILHQQRLLDRIYVRYQLQSLDDWLLVSTKKWIKYGAEPLLRIYKMDKISMLRSIYPFHQFNFELIREKDPVGYYSVIDHQRAFMDNLFVRMRMKRLHELEDIRAERMVRKRGRVILVYYHHNHYPSLLSSLYPNYPFSFIKEKGEEEERRRVPYTSLRKKERRIEEIERMGRRIGVDRLGKWEKMGKRKFSKHGGSSLLKFYHNNMYHLLTDLYPNYPWDLLALSSRHEQINLFQRIDYQRSFFDQLFYKLKLKRLGDWARLMKYKIICNGGIMLMKYYRYDRKLLLSTLYPNYPWINEEFRFSNNMTKYFKSLDHQRAFLDSMFIQLKMKKMDDWLQITRNKILSFSGGEKLLKIYHYNLRSMLTSVYHDHRWNFTHMKITNPNLHFRHLDNQRRFMDQLFLYLDLKCLDDWLSISRRKIIRHGGKAIVFYYNNDKKEILRKIYPNYPWKISGGNGNGNSNYYYYGNNNGGDISISSNRFAVFTQRLKELQCEFEVKQKKDWYRLRLDFHASINLFDILKLLYPNERWIKSNFLIRSKKYKQRLVYSYVQKIYRGMVVYENYHHPLLLTNSNSNSSYEYDIFLPSLNLALEYQGEHHFDDIPSGFATIEIFQLRDREKELLTGQLEITLIYIPFWWDLSFSSLVSTLHQNRFFIPS